jgi:hypothetical protein
VDGAEITIRPQTRFAKPLFGRYLTSGMMRMLFRQSDCPFGCSIHTRRRPTLPWRWYTTLTKLPNAKAFAAGADHFARVAELIYRPGLSKSTVSRLHQVVFARMYSLEESGLRLDDAIRIVCNELSDQGVLCRAEQKAPTTVA